MAYKKLLIQQQTFDGTAYTNVGSVVDTYAQFGIACQEFPFKHLPESKDLPKRDWYDENGEDVYMPTDGLKYKAYDIEAKFIYKGAEADMAESIRNFTSFIYGFSNIPSQGQSPTRNVFLKVYDEYTQTGRRGIYVQEVSDEMYYYNDSSIEAIATFKVKFRVTDPVTNVSYNSENNTLNG